MTNNPQDTEPQTPPKAPEISYWGALRNGLLLGAGVLVIALPTLRYFHQGAGHPAGHVGPGNARQVVIRHADFGSEPASPAARQMANWVVHSGDHGKMSFAIIDKKDARVFLFDPQGRLQAATPALLGAAVGDDSFPGIGDKPLSQVLPEEKTTPAGRFVTELGTNTHGEDIVWVDYDAAVSMHRVRATVKAEHRLERLASPTPDDNRISFGCINLPPPFYETKLRPAVEKTGVVAYVLPETRGLRQVFAQFYDVDSALKMAQQH